MHLTGYARAQTWLPTVHEVLQADWQETWHLPQAAAWGAGRGTAMVRTCLLPVSVMVLDTPPFD
jgi:hypothetical protein